VSWEPELEELRRRQEMARAMGGADKVKRQHDAGRLTVRERIEALLDPDSFHEVGELTGQAEYQGTRLRSVLPTNFVMGRGRIEGRPVVVGGDDFTVRGGAADASIFQKQVHAEQMANELRIPLVRGRWAGPTFPSTPAGTWSWPTCRRCPWSALRSVRWRDWAPRAWSQAITR
jgi:acetyl-CoA carboxylase carboxyltransferase component